MSVEIKMVFIGTITGSDGSRLFVWREYTENGVLPEMTDNNTWWFKKQIVPSNLSFPGVCFAFNTEIKDDGTRSIYSYGKHNSASISKMYNGIWSNNDDLAKMQAGHYSNEAALANTAKARRDVENIFRNILAPIREAYLRSDSVKRTLIIAEVIKRITQ